jgi:hypothetical protein
MSREDIARLLGGYATGTLTPEEQQALLAAALEDQALFDELAREQALRDLLREPAARAQLLAALEDHPRWYRRFGDWRFGDWMMRPAALTAAAACLLLLGAMAVWRPWRGNEAAKTDLIATALPRETRPIPPLPAIAEQKKLAPLEAGEVTKAKTPLASPAMPAAVLRATPEAKKELLVAESAAPVAAGNAVLPAASPPPPPAKATNTDTITDLAITARDVARLPKFMPGAATGGAAGNAPAIGAFSANGTQPNGAMATTSGNDARQRYYADTALGAAKAEAQTQNLRAAPPRPPASQPAPLGIKWSILRRHPNAAFVIVNAEDLRAGDTVELRLIPNQTCEVAVFDNASGRLLPLFSNHVEAGEAYDTPPLAPREPGLRELVVELTRSGNVAGGIAGAQPVAPQAAQQSETDRSEHATYTVGPAGAQQVSLSITLNYR